MISQHIADARKIVIKFGSNTLAGKDGKINSALLAEFAEQAAALMKKSAELSGLAGFTPAAFMLRSSRKRRKNTASSGRRSHTPQWRSISQVKSYALISPACW